MGHSDSLHSWKFDFEGRFLGFGGQNPVKLKYLWLEDSNENVQIKLPKELRTSLRLILQPGDRVRVLGRGKRDRATSELKLKAHRVIPLPATSDQSPDYPSDFLSSPSPQTLNQRPPTVKPSFDQSEAKILVCQKSKCGKKGGRQLLRSLETALRSLNLQDQVRIEYTDCMKCCSSAPQFVIMPGKHRYRQVRTEIIIALLKEHYSHL